MIDNEQPEFNLNELGRTIRLLVWCAIILFILTLLFGCVSHKPRLDKYDENGMIKSSTPYKTYE